MICHWLCKPITQGVPETNCKEFWQFLQIFENFCILTVLMYRSIVWPRCAYVHQNYQNTKKFKNLPKLSKFLAICFWDSLCDGFTQSVMNHPRYQGYLSSFASLGLSLSSFSFLWANFTITTVEFRFKLQNLNTAKLRPLI